VRARWAATRPTPALVRWALLSVLFLLVALVPSQAWALRASVPDVALPGVSTTAPDPCTTVLSDERKAACAFADVKGPVIGSISFDGLGSATALTNASGTATSRFHLDAWGVFKSPAELAATKSRAAFTGYFWDQATGLYNANARWYDPTTARFTSQDSYLGTIDEPPSLHRYIYANSNPTRYTDPTGHYIATDEERRQLGRMFNRQMAPLIKDNRPDWERGEAQVYRETLFAEFTGRVFAPTFKTYYGLKNMSQLGDGSPRMFIEGQVETVMAGAIPLVVKEGAGALVDRVPVLGTDVGVFAKSALSRARAALEPVTQGAQEFLSSVAERLPRLEWSADPGANLGNLKFAKRPSGVPADDFVPNPAAGRYTRATGTTAAQRASVQGKPCVDCGETAARQVADHIDPQVVQHFREGKVDVEAQRALDAVQPHCPTCSATQGGWLAQFGRRMKEALGLE
jgi:RHS repeat-associated protein